MNAKKSMGLRSVLGVAAAALCAGHVSAQVVVSNETFDAPGTAWTANGVETLVNDGRGIDGQYLQLPYMDFFGAHLRSEDARCGLLGDLSRYPNGVTLSFDMVTFQFHDFDNNDIPVESRPLILQLWDRGDPDDFTDDVSVWVENGHIPAIELGWQRMTFEIPTPTSATLPAGWGGTGDEDPVTFEPRLPPGRTYASVLASVDEVQVTTFKPGYFYGFAFWEIGYDNVRVTQPQPPTCECDVTGDNALSVQDIFDYLAAYFASNMVVGDFNGDGSISVQDIFDYLACYFTGC